ncbi:MAG: hypothetical protein ACFFDR_14720 [Candidatus Thorarchaeota archaeon]
MARVPLGVIILGVLNFLTGILLLIGSTPLLADFNWILLTGIIQGLPYGAILVGLAYILLGFGLISLARWAWYADIILALINLLLIVVDILGAGSIQLGNIPWISLILNLIIVVYLNQRSIRRKFDV